MIIPTRPRHTPSCTLEEAGVSIYKAAEECASNGLSCDTCDYFELIPPVCRGYDCDSCHERAEGNCLPVE